MVLAEVDAERVAEAAVGLVLVLAVLGLAAGQLTRWLHDRRPAVDAGRPALARFADAPITDATAFGGGAGAARVRRRRDAVTYGYLGVAEEFVADGSGTSWCALTVTLPGRVPFLVVDHRSAIGRPDVPMSAPYRGPLGDAAFDAVYLVGAEEEWLLGRILVPAVREQLLRHPVQRLMLRDSALVIRTFDGVALDGSVLGALVGGSERFLSSTPSFVRSSRAAAGALTPAARTDEPLRPGLYGPN